jgi:hypothetical protein
VGSHRRRGGVAQRPRQGGEARSECRAYAVASCVCVGGGGGCLVWWAPCNVHLIRWLDGVSRCRIPGLPLGAQQREGRLPALVMCPAWRTVTPHLWFQRDVPSSTHHAVARWPCCLTRRSEQPCAVVVAARRHPPCLTTRRPPTGSRLNPQRATPRLRTRPRSPVAALFSVTVTVGALRTLSWRLRRRLPPHMAALVVWAVSAAWAVAPRCTLALQAARSRSIGCTYYSSPTSLGRWPRPTIRRRGSRRSHAGAAPGPRLS